MSGTADFSAWASTQPGQAVADAPPYDQPATTTPQQSADLDARGAVLQMYSLHYAGIVRLGVLLGAGDAAEDLAQETFIRLHQNWPKLRSRERTIGWLRKTMLNLVRARGRQQAAILRIVPDPSGDAASAEHQVLLGNDRNEVVNALNTLPDRQREAMVLRYYLGLGEREIASSMGCSIGSVRTHTKRAMASLAKILGGVL